MTPTLIEHSRSVILQNQQPSGAYPACPTMPDYQFCWFRDGSFIAHSMFLYGEIDSANAFHQWAARTILQYEDGARRAIAAMQAGKKPDAHDVLRARYTYDSRKGPDEWPEFQLDGLGTWLWALKAYQDGGHSLDENVLRAAHFTADYLSVTWPSPCHDLWEESGDRVHTYTLGALFAGLQAAAALFNMQPYSDSADEICRYMLTHSVRDDGSFIKAVGDERVDGSLPALATPYRVEMPGSSSIKATVRRVESDLYVPGFGVHRYLGDSYYGGGAWLLLAAWLGWYYAECGDLEKTRAILSDIERSATPDGDMPEQLAPPMLADTSYFDYWVKVRGPVATPLLWSHAMYLIAAHACT